MFKWWVIYIFGNAPRFDVVHQLCTRLTLDLHCLQNAFKLYLCQSFTLISTDKGFKALKKRNLHCIKKIVIASFTGKFYRGFHAAPPFVMPLAGCLHWPAQMVSSGPPHRRQFVSGTAGCGAAGGVV
jgi:hypothetical protein